MFREAVLALLTGGESEKKEPENEYCAICRAAKKDHCETCDRTFRTIGGKSDG